MTEEAKLELIRALAKDNAGIQINIDGKDISYNKIIIDGKEEKDFLQEDIFNEKAGGISDRKDFWLLLIAAQARGIVVGGIAEFIERCFAIWNIPFDKDLCISSTTELLKGKPWRGVKDQQSMFKFIEEMSKQRNVRENRKRIADNIFVALKENTGGKN